MLRRQLFICFLFFLLISNIQAKQSERSLLSSRKLNLRFPPPYGQYKCNCCKLIDKGNGDQSYCQFGPNVCHGTASKEHKNGVNCSEGCYENSRKCTPIPTPSPTPTP